MHLQLLGGGRQQPPVLPDATSVSGRAGHGSWAILATWQVWKLFRFLRMSAQ